MSHNLFGERFLGNRAPAWHRLGVVVTDEKVGAREAFRRVGEYEVSLQPDPAGPRQRIVRAPTGDDSRERIFGTVGPDYDLVAPKEICTLWDEALSVPVETLGALGCGETLFISADLTAGSILGDPVRYYLVLVNPLGGDLPLELRVTPVRVVCQNTLIMSRSRGTRRVLVPHDMNARAALRDLLPRAFAEAVADLPQIHFEFTAMATTPVRSEQQIRQVLAAAYPEPPPPPTGGPDLSKKSDPNQQPSDDKRSGRPPWGEGQELAAWHHYLQVINRKRDLARHLFEGHGRGMDHPAARGTLYGLWNAVVEIEDYDGPACFATGIARSALFGSRSRAKVRAFNAALDLVMHARSTRSIHHETVVHQPPVVGHVRELKMSG